MTLGSFLTFFHGALGQDLALVQHRDLVRDVLDENHVVLDHQHRAVLDDPVEQLGGLDAFADAHAGDRLVEHQQVGVLDQQHADLEPLLLAVAEQSRHRCSRRSFEEDHLGDFLDRGRAPGVARERQRAEHGTAARKGDLQVLEHGEIVVDRRRLELAADAGLHDLVLLHPRQFLAAELDRARCGLGLAADQIEHRGLAGAVGADDDADLVFLDIEATGR